MKAFAIDAGLAALALALGVSAMQRGGGSELFDAPVPVPPSAAQHASRMTDAMLEQARENVIRRNPFRINRAPGAVRVGDVVNAVPSLGAPTVIAPQRPPLIVRAIVGGPPWNAVLDGLPNGAPATVVREGDEFGEIRIGVITRDTLVAAVRDSVWKYGVHRDPQ